MDTSQLRKTRKEVGLSQQKAADRLGVHVTTYSRIEREGAGLTVNRLQEIADAFGVPLSQLLPRGSINSFHEASLVPVIESNTLSLVKADRLVDVVRAWGGETIMANTSAEDCFAVPVEDDSIGRRAPRGSLAIVSPSDTLLTAGKIFLIRQGSRVMLRVFKEDGGIKRFEGESASADVPTVFDLTSIITLGRVVQAIVPL